MAKTEKDLIRGSSDPSVVKSYNTKSFKHEGTTGSEPEGRLNENGNKGITTQVMEENNAPTTKIVGKPVKTIAVGSGMPADSGKVKGSGSKEGAGMVGANNVNSD